MASNTVHASELRFLYGMNTTHSLKRSPTFKLTSQIHSWQVYAVVSSAKHSFPTRDVKANNKLLDYMGSCMLLLQLIFFLSNYIFKEWHKNVSNIPS